MRFLSRFVIALAIATIGGFPLSAQTPRVYLKFDGDLTDSSAAGIITTVATSAGFTPTYTTDRNGVANKALVLPGSASLELIAAALPADANTALGLRGGPGGSPFTLSAWVNANALSVASSYNTAFGNTGSGVGTLHAGLLNNRAHFGFEGNDANGVVATFDQTKWYHLAFVYDGVSQRIYINGVPEITRTATNTLKASNLLIGNWNSPTSSTNDLAGQLDDVVVFNSALNIGQIQALHRGVDANSLPSIYSASRMPGPLGSAGFWGVREVKSYPGIAYASLVNADRVFNSYATAVGGTVANYNAPVINHTDPQSAGITGYFVNEANFGTNLSGNDDNFALLAKGTIRIAVEDDYTFGFRGDEGSRLRIQGAIFSTSTAIGTGNQANPPVQGDAIYYTSDTTDSATLGVTHLTPGDYNIEFVYWEHNGTASCEVFAARGAKTIVDASFQLVGNTAAGGLEMVRDLDSYPQIISFTGNGANAVVVNGGSPSAFTLAWQTNSVATSVTIAPDLGAVANSGSQVIVSPTQTTTYTITATAGADVATRTLTVYVDSPPVITGFAANPTNVAVGSNVTLSWATVGAASLMLQPGNIDVTGTFSRVVNPAASTTYTLFATNSFGTVQQSVNVVAGSPPVINSFVVADPSPLYGAETSLNWNVTGANSISINQGIGAISGVTGSVSIAPLQTTTYTLTATNIYGATTATATLNVPTPIGVTAAGFSARKVVSSVAFPFAGQGYLQSAVSLVGGQNVASQVTQNNYTTVNFWDGSIDGDFATNNLSFPGGSIGINTAVIVTATLVVNTPGEYTFVLNSDDGARLRIDGQDVIADDSTHSPSGNSGKITLSKQTATLELIYYNVAGGAEVELAWIRPNLTWQLLTTITPAAPIVRGQVLISEFMANNDGTLLDEDGASSDWIEIWNSTNATVNLSGYFLTDNPSAPAKWAIPAWTLGANKYLLAFASSNNRSPAQAVAGQDNPGTLAQPHMHTNFGLSKTGGYLALTKSDGAGGYTFVSEFVSYPGQSKDISYGSSDSEGYVGFIDTPTPGGPNAATVGGFVSRVTFDHPRGRYSAPFTLALTSATPGATIRYTLNGSAPTLNSGTIYSSPLLVSSSRVVRAAAFKAGWRSSSVETHSYLYIDDIVTQTAGTATALGFPATAVNGQTYRYGMTLGNVTSGGGTLQSLKNALAAIPTVSMSTDVANLTDAATGIYSNPGRHGLFWERPVSMEYINAAGTSEFAINCGARIRGGFSRATNNPKHAFHMYFRGSLYDGDLNYRLFGNAGASQFSQIDMRSEENYSWAFQNDAKNLLVREEWSRITQGDMGQPYARNGYFHLYLNGVYWGIYNFEERTEASFGETYLGGVKENFDVVKSAGSSGGYNTEMTDGNFAAWYSLTDQALALKNDATETGRTAKYMKMRGLNPDGTRNAAFPVLLDADNLIDYELVVFYDGSFDSPMSTFLANASNNWFGARDRLGMNGFVFFAHDHEHGMDSVTDGRAYNRIGPWGGSGTNNWGQGQYNSREGGTLYSKSNPHYLQEFLCFSAEYRQHFADRVQRHFYNGGALTTAKSIGRFNALTAQIDTFIHAEAARWGSAALNRNSWLTAKAGGEAFINSGGAPAGGQTTFPVQPRTTLVVEQLRGYTDNGAKPLFTPNTLLAPAVSGAFGGNVLAPYNFTLSNPNAIGAIYYTTNGADPRPIGGGAPSGAQTGASPISITLNNSAVLRARIYDGNALKWSPLIEPEFIAGIPASAANLVISKIHYHPASVGGLEEFIELLNIGANNIDLSNVRFTIGIQFDFPFGYLLAPGARVLIVRDMGAFTAAYPNVPAGQIVGVFANGSSLNNAGERLQLIDAANAVIRDFTYGDAAPWPADPDGLGPALVLMRPEKNPDHSIAANWRDSAANDGTPGVSDAITYAGWAAANGVVDLIGTVDDEGDGLANLCEYALGLDPKAPSPHAVIPGTQNYVVGSVAADYLTLTFTRPIGRDEVTCTVEASTDLASAWTSAVLVSGPINNGNGTEIYVYRHPLPLTALPQQFLRLKVTRLP